MSSPFLLFQEEKNETGQIFEDFTSDQKKNGCK